MSRKKQAKLIRRLRKIHRTTGMFLFIFFFIIAVTGLLLGWKKNSNGTILPKSVQGTSSDLSKWLSIDSLTKNATKILSEEISSDLSSKLTRIDIRDRKGMVKFVYDDHLYEIQLDGVTGELLQIGYRRSELFESIHDATILDKFFNTKGEPFKLIYTSITGLALLTFTISGFWLWYGPKRMRRMKRKESNDKR